MKIFSLSATETIILSNNYALIFGKKRMSRIGFGQSGNDLNNSRFARSAN